MLSFAVDKLSCFFFSKNEIIFFFLGEPREVQALTTTATEVRLTWMAPLASQQNGDLLGYKIFYLATSQSIDKEEMEVVPASHTAHSLPFLDMFTEYRIQIVAFNPAGDGPRSSPVTVRTLQGIPGSPGPLRYPGICTVLVLCVMT